MVNTGRSTRKRYGLLNTFLSLIGFTVIVTMFTGVFLFFLMHSTENLGTQFNIYDPLSFNHHVFPRDVMYDQNQADDQDDSNRTYLFMSFSDKQNLVTAPPSETGDTIAKHTGRLSKQIQSVSEVRLPNPRKRRTRPKVARLSERIEMSDAQQQNHRHQLKFRKQVITEKTDGRLTSKLQRDSQAKLGPVKTDSQGLSNDRLNSSQPEKSLLGNLYPQPKAKQEQTTNSSILSDKNSARRTKSFHKQQQFLPSKESSAIQSKLQIPTKSEELSSMKNQSYAVTTSSRSNRDSLLDRNTSYLSEPGNENPNTKDAYADKRRVSIPYTMGHPHHQQVSEQFPNTPTEKRRSLLIFGDDRSGTTFVTKMFAEDPQMFTIYEPLWATKEWAKEVKMNDYNILVNRTVDLINALLSCKLAVSPAGKRFLEYAVTSWVDTKVFPNNVFRTSAFAKVSRTGKTFWPNLQRTPHFAEEVCRSKFKHSVVKVGQVRVPGQSISLFIPRILNQNPNTDVRVIQIVRDPRGSINSRIKYGWVSDYTFMGFPRYVADTCAKITANVKFGRNIKSQWVKDRYMEVTYREITTMPVLTARKIYNFAGFKMPDSLVDWIIESTNPNEDQLQQAVRNPYPHVRDSSKNDIKWRSESPLKRVRIIEEQCKELLDLLGLDPVAKEMELLCS